MAIVRYSSTSDVYVYLTVAQGPGLSLVLVCDHGADHFADHNSFHTKRYSEMHNHLLTHEAAGLRVPVKVYDYLACTAKKRGDIVRTDQELRRAKAGQKRKS